MAILEDKYIMVALALRCFPARKFSFATTAAAADAATTTTTTTTTKGRL